jgi:hypothetical protein
LIVYIILFSFKDDIFEEEEENNFLFFWEGWREETIEKLQFQIPLKNLVSTYRIGATTQPL